MTTDDKHSPASDSAVEAILSALHPLRAVKFVDAAPTQGTTIEVQIDAGGGGVLVTAHHVLQIVDPGESKPAVATYNGVHFEVEHTLISQLESKFDLPTTVAPAPPPAPAQMGGPEMQMP
jgi:hypothetical protein